MQVPLVQLSSAPADHKAAANGWAAHLDAPAAADAAAPVVSGHVALLVRLSPWPFAHRLCPPVANNLRHFVQKALFFLQVDGTMGFEIVARHHAARWPWLSDVSLLQALLSIVLPPDKQPPAAPAVLPWTYANVVLDSTQIFVPFSGDLPRLDAALRAASEQAVGAAPEPGAPDECCAARARRGGAARAAERASRGAAGAVPAHVPGEPGSSACPISGGWELVVIRRCSSVADLHRRHGIRCGRRSTGCKTFHAALSPAV